MSKVFLEDGSNIVLLSEISGMSEIKYASERTLILLKGGGSIQFDKTYSVCKDIWMEYLPKYLVG